eukprot:CAMPEP_0197181248 /NCGR_PEP_ID=MMETSP1423-20130617/5594_1 /TAXON_ID=476441 /ORGANISM="Pseudo-nitzschia heimii, Strain UNC1101" /LENGTH=781 /DNA_ID=CAMNT_0042631469 /DNA_START=174 /DNA_END=2519 /DNA_ORIENTATION=+
MFVKEIESLNDTCSIGFTGKYIDTEDDAVVASKQVMARLTAGERVCAFIGATPSYSESIQTSVIANIFGNSMISGMSVASTLDHPTNYPRFARTIPSTYGPMSAFVKYAHEKLKYKFLVILSHDDVHSTDLVMSIRSTINSYDKEAFVVREIFIQNESEIKNGIERLKDLQFTTVIAIFEGTEFGDDLYDPVMKEAYKQEVAGNGDHVWFFPEGVLEHSKYLRERRYDDVPRDSELFHAYRGAGIITSGGLGPRFSQLANEMKKYSRYLESTNRTQLILPNPHKDININAITEIVNQKSFLNENYLDSRTQFLYEATVLAGLSACAASTGDLQLNGKDFHDYLVTYKFPGITGHVKLDGESGSRDANSVEYSVMNVRAMNIFNMSTDDFHVELRQAATIGEQVNIVDPFIFNDGTDTKPRPVWEKNITTVYIGDGVLYIALILCGLSVVAAVVSAIWTYLNRKTRIIRASQPFFLYLICFGTILVALDLMTVTIITSTEMDMNQKLILCGMSPWLFFVGLSVWISSFYSKLYRINKIMKNAKNFKRITVEVKDAIHPVIITVSLNILILSLMTALRPLQMQSVNFKDDRFKRDTHMYKRCDFITNWNNVWYYMIPLIVVDAGIFFLAANEAWKARHLSTEFQENDAIIQSLAILVLGLSITLPVLGMTPDPKIRVFIFSALYSVTCLSIQGFLFGKKYLYQKEQTDQNTLAVESMTDQEKLFASQGRQELALENHALREKIKILEMRVTLYQRTRRESDDICAPRVSSLTMNLTMKDYNTE